MRAHASLCMFSALSSLLVLRFQPKNTGSRSTGHYSAHPSSSVPNHLADSLQDSGAHDDCVRQAGHDPGVFWGTNAKAHQDGLVRGGTHTGDEFAKILRKPFSSSGHASDAKSPT